MSIDRRTFVAGATAVSALPPNVFIGIAKDQKMYGLIGKMTAHLGHRDELVKLLVEGVAGMPGCLSYIVAKDPTDGNLIWITEAWESKEAHAASLALPSVKAAITKGGPLIAEMSAITETIPVGGHGLAGSRKL